MNRLGPLGAVMKIYSTRLSLGAARGKSTRLKGAPPSLLLQCVVYLSLGDEQWAYEKGK